MTFLPQIEGGLLDCKRDLIFLSEAEAPERLFGVSIYGRQLDGIDSSAFTAADFVATKVSRFTLPWDLL